MSDCRQNPFWNRIFRRGYRRHEDRRRRAWSLLRSSGRRLYNRRCQRPISEWFRCRNGGILRFARKLLLLLTASTCLAMSRNTYRNYHYGYTNSKPHSGIEIRNTSWFLVLLPWFRSFFSFPYISFYNVQNVAAAPRFRTRNTIIVYTNTTSFATTHKFNFYLIFVYPIVCYYFNKLFIITHILLLHFKIIYFIALTNDSYTQ